MGYLIALVTDVDAHAVDVLNMLHHCSTDRHGYTDVSAYCRNHNQAISTPPLVSLTRLTL